MTWFVVTLPDSTQEFELPDKSKGQDLLDAVSMANLKPLSRFYLLNYSKFNLVLYFSHLQVCEKLEVIEQDYFGLQYNGPKGEKLWLNRRNKIGRQLPGSQPYRLRFRMKFFVQPHLLVEDNTK
jgi:E3 ubiquitin-protein ligase MYLIP